VLLLWLWDAIIARLEWGAAGAFVVCAATHCADADKSKQQEQTPTQTVTAEPRPPIVGDEKARPSKGQLVIAADSDNQCYLEAFANGQKFRFLLDTGASSIFFTMADARKLGLDPASLSYDHSYSQWGGKVRGATFKLREFRVGGFVLHDVDAVIDRTDYDTPLLGAPVLKAMNFQVRDGSCVLSIPRNAASVRPETTRAMPAYKPAIDKPGEPVRAANGEPLDGVCQEFVRNRLRDEQYAYFAAKCEKYSRY
jgi:clan AA aspartic protease (TIGR02281 family)